MATKKKTKEQPEKKPAKKKASAKKTPAKKAPAKKAAAKAPKAEKAAPVAAGPRHPAARLAAAHGSKQALAKTLAAAIARDDEDHGVIADRLGKASNSQLLRLHDVVETVKQKYGGRAKLIAAIGTAQNKSKDQDFLTKLDSFSLPHLLDLARASAPS
jgi:hypothetical protein